jgi:hypothetical protein
MEAAPGSIMEKLGKVKDPRRREGKRYRLPGLIGMLVLAAVNGEKSLRGMWLWGRSHWGQIAEPLDLTGTKGAPAYGTLWELMAGLDSEELSKALSQEEQPREEGYTIDGKKLRGSKRASEPALQVVTLAGANYGEILGQQEVEAGDEVEATIALLRQTPLAGKIVSMDAGLLQREVVKTITQKGGPTSGQSKAIMGKSMTW